MIDNDWITIAARLGLATLVGLVLGFEREWHGHDAGLRTHALVALSSAMITVSALLMADALNRHGTGSDPLRVIQGLAQAIGFIAGGLIFIRGSDVRNMTTAVNLWMAAAIGIAAGAGQFLLLLVGAGLTLLLLVATRLLKRLLPRHHRHADGHGEPIGPPNRRGAYHED